MTEFEQKKPYFPMSDVLDKLCGAIGVSGDEKSVSKIAAKLLEKYTDDVKTDSFGNVTGFIGDRSNGKPVLLLEAHIDEIGFIVTYIDDNGFVKVGKCGGTDRRAYAAQTVTIHGRKTPVRGVIATLPPHVSKDTKTAMKHEEIVIDTGYTKEQLEKMIRLGDRVTIDSKSDYLIYGQKVNKALDDRSGVAAVLYALHLLQNEETAFNIAVLFAVQEETGGSGAKIGAYNIDADVAICTDVSYAYTPGCKKEKCGEMGKGAMIGISPVLKLNDLEGTARRADVEYQFEVMSGETGTDADEISVSKGGIPTGLLSIPLKYMHTPVEVVDECDVKTVGCIMAQYAIHGNADYIMEEKNTFNGDGGSIPSGKSLAEYMEKCKAEEEQE